MADTDSELSIEQIHEYFVEKGGLVANRDVVKHFRRYLTDPASKDDARIKFKKYINILASTKAEGDEKFLVLRPKYATCLDSPITIPPTSPQRDPRNSLGIPLSPTHSISDSNPSASNSPSHRQPPPYRAPPPPPPPNASPNISFDNISMCSSTLSLQDACMPQAPPRKKSADKLKCDPDTTTPKDSQSLEMKQSETGHPETDKQPISVKERTKKFDRLASLEEGTSPKQQEKKKPEKEVEEDDGAAVIPLDQKKCTEWIVTASKGDYHDLLKLASSEPRLVKYKDPFTATVLHWGAKYGNQEIIKLFAGTYKADVNAKTNGGYTPLHIAAQFGHKQVFNLLIEVYKADPNLRDFSGRKPLQYDAAKVQVTHKDTYKLKSRRKLADKDLRFLRIGSLNVKVKKTTEAFSNFLGVGSGSSINPTDTIADKMHKSWGSVDNIGPENMPAPKGYLGKKKTRKIASSTPGTPRQSNRSLNYKNSVQDSDSDTAAGFDSNWQH